MVTPRLRLRVCGAALLAIAALSAACGSGSKQTSLQKALGDVQDSSAARVYFGFVDVGRMREVGALPDGVALLTLAQHGRAIGVLPFAHERLLAGGSRTWRLTGIDVLAADRQISIGDAPREALRLDGGVDFSAVEHRLRAYGARSRTSGSRSFLTLGAQGHIDRTWPLATLGVVDDLDRVVADGQSLAFGPFEAPVEQVLGGGTALGRDPSYAAVADCLGDVLGAAIVPATITGLHAGTMVVAMGTRDLGSRTKLASEVLCLVHRDRAGAERQAAAIRKGLHKRVDVATGKPLRMFVQSSVVDVVEGHDRYVTRAVVTLAKGQPPGFLNQALVRGLLPGYVDGVST
jgi:hypothetical protein